LKITNSQKPQILALNFCDCHDFFTNAEFLRQNSRLSRIKHYNLHPCHYLDSELFYLLMASA